MIKSTKKFRCALILALILIWSSSLICLAAARTKQYYDVGLKSPALGYYEFGVTSYEKPSNEVLPIVDKSYFPKTFSTYTSEIDNMPPSALYNKQTIQKVDVVFALGSLSQSSTLQNYIPTFTSALNSAGNHIDAKVEQVKTSQLDLSTSFNWVTDVNNSISSIFIQNGGQTINMYGNPSNPGTGAMWVIPEGPVSKQTLKFSYSLNFGDSFDAGGVLLNCKLDGNVLTGYAISFNNHNYKYECAGANAALWKIVYTKGAYADDMTKTLITPLNISSSGYLEVTSSSNSITVSGGGLPAPVVVSLPTYYGMGFGFFSDHYAHGCDETGQFVLSNISLTRSTAKSLGEAISDVAWRNDALKFVIHATDIIPDDMVNTSGSQYNYTITKLLNSDAYLLNLGNAINNGTLNRLLQDISEAGGEQKGVCFSNSPITTALNNSSTWIINKAKSMQTTSDWILVNTEVLWENTYNDSERDLPLNYGKNVFDSTLSSMWGKPLTNLFTSSKLVAERWRYKHDNLYFDNSLVQESYHNIWIEDPVAMFPYAGQYRINYKRKDNPLYPDVSDANIFSNYKYWSKDYDLKTK